MLGSRKLLLVVVIVFLLALGAGLLGYVLAQGDRVNGRACTHGVSSVGPETIVKGEPPRGQTTPDTQTCLH